MGRSGAGSWQSRDLQWLPASFLSVAAGVGAYSITACTGEVSINKL